MSDNSGLIYVFDESNLNARKARRLTTFSEFNFKIKYIKSRENKVVDTLNRRV